jgi:hypothetical protein
MDQIILKYIDKQNYFFLNYFEKKVFNLKNDFLGFFNIKNDSLQITWNNKFIEEFIFYTKNNELINIYKNINEHHTDINIIHKKWSSQLIINNNTNQVFNSLEQIYGIIQEINNNTIKINWQNNIYEHEVIEKFILNSENNNYYLMEEDILIKNDFKKIYIKYLKGKKIIKKQILLDESYNIIYDFNNLNIIGSYKIIETKYYIQCNLLNEYIFSKINDMLYSEIILKYIYKSILIENINFYLYKKEILNVNNIKYYYNIEYNYIKGIIVLFMNDKQYVYDLYTLKDITFNYIKEIIFKNEFKEEYYQLNFINNKLFSLTNKQEIYSFEINNNYLSIKYENNNNDNDNNKKLYYFENNTNTYILNKLLEKKEYFFHKDWKKLCILDKEFIYKDNDKGIYQFNNNKIIVKWELWNQEIFYKYNSIYYSDIFFYDIIIDNFEHKYKIFNLFNLILDENFITIYKVEFIEDKIKLITENNVEFFNYELQDNTYILYSKKNLEIQLVNDNNFYYLYKDLYLYTKNNIINPIAKVITIKNNKLIIQNTNDNNDNNDNNVKIYIYLNKSKNIYYLESLKIENIILINKDKSIQSLILDNIEKKIKCEYFEKNIIKNNEELLLFDYNILTKYYVFYDNIYIESHLLNYFKNIHFNLDIAYIFDYFKTSNKLDSLKHFLNNELLIYSFETFNKKYLTLNNSNFNNLKYYFEILFNNIDNNTNNNIDNSSNINNKLIIINCIDINDLLELNKFLFENKKDKDYLLIIINKKHIFKQNILNLKNYYNNLIIFENNIIKNSSIFHFIYYYVKKYNLLFQNLIYLFNDDYKIQNKNNLKINKMNKNILLFIKNKYDFTFLILFWYLKNYTSLDLDNINFEITRINFFDLFNIF